MHRCFSRYLQVVPLKSKSSLASTNALKGILDSEQSKGYSRLFTDLGSEFHNSKVKHYLTSKNIRLYTTFSREIKASLAERVLKTIKHKIYKYLTEYNTLTYIDALPSIVHAYNTTPHSSLGKGQTPNQVHNLSSVKDIMSQFWKMYKNKPTQSKRDSSHLDIGDIVRLQLASRTQFKFSKGFLPVNTEELFKIRRVDTSQVITTYYLEDLAGEDIEGIFYRQEIIKASLPETYQVDILKSKVVKGKIKYLVQWRGYPSKFNTWINATDLFKI